MPPITPPPEVPLLPEEGTPRRRKPGQQRNTQSAKPKKVTTAELAATMVSLMQAIPTLTSQVEQLHRRQVEFESCLSTTTSSGRPMLSKPLGGLPPQNSSLLGDVMKSIPGPPRTQARTAPGLLASPQVKKPFSGLGTRERQFSSTNGGLIFGKGRSSPVPGPHHPGDTNRLCFRRPHVGTSLDHQPHLALEDRWEGPGCNRNSLPTVAASFTSVLAQNGKTYEPHLIGGSIAKGAVGGRSEWREVLGEIWRLWQAERSWLPSVPGHADFRLPHGREPHGCSRLGRSPGYHPGTDEYGWWSLGLGGRGLPSRRPTGIDLPDATLELHQPQPCFRTTSRSKASNSGIGVSQRTRRHPEQAPRVGGGSASKSPNSGGWSAKAEAKGRSQKAPKVEGEGRHPGGGLEDDGVSF